MSEWKRMQTETWATTQAMKEPRAFRAAYLFSRKPVMPLHRDEKDLHAAASIDKKVEKNSRLQRNDSFEPNGIHCRHFSRK